MDEFSSDEDGTWDTMRELRLDGTRAVKLAGSGDVIRVSWRDFRLLRRAGEMDIVKDTLQVWSLAIKLRWKAARLTVRAV